MMQRKLKSMFRRSVGKPSELPRRTPDSNGDTSSKPASRDTRNISASGDAENRSSVVGHVSESTAANNGSGLSQPSHSDTAPHSAKVARKSVPIDHNPLKKGEFVNSNEVRAYSGDVRSGHGVNGNWVPSSQDNVHRGDLATFTNSNQRNTDAAPRGVIEDKGTSLSSSDYEYDSAHSKVTNGEDHTLEGGPVQFQSATKVGEEDVDQSKLHRQLRLDGVVDLTDTVDTDGDIKWAPAVTKEIVKPHQHEIVQQEIFREVHNYDHFHHIQPVMMTEVLPPRHWIPNPDGDGLLEILADELPARTGENRWWSVIQHESPHSKGPQIKWRTEPEIIEHGTTILENGTRRRETTIIHPPTLANLKGYNGPVQPVHFDHKTGERWLGEMSTMDELQDLQKLLDSAPEAHAFHLNELNESLPGVTATPTPVRKAKLEGIKH